MELWDFQKDIVQRARQSVAAGNRKILIQSATGSGKTVIGSSIIHSSSEKKKKSIFLAHRREIITQTSRKFDSFDVQHGIIMAGQTQEDWHSAQIASIDTLRSRVLKKSSQRLPRASLAMIDEAHRSVSATYQKIINLYTEMGSIIIGLTATPIRSDGKGLGHVYDDMILGPPIAWLIEKGYLVQPEYYAPYVPDLKGVETRGGDYNEGQVDEVMDKPELVGDVVGHYLRIAAGKRAIVFATSVANSINLRNEFISAGVRAAHIDGKTPNEERDQILIDFEDGLIDVISNYGVLTEGWDCPSAEVCILFRPTKHIGLLFQMIGRVLRAYPGKEKAIVIDHSGSTTRLGYVEDPIPWSLDKNGKLWDKIKEKREKAELREFICEKCFHKFKNSRVCPECGYEIQNRGQYIETKDGQLEKVDTRKKKTKEKVYSVEEKQLWYSMLLGYAIDKKYNKGWAYHKFKEKIGVYPSSQLRQYATPPNDECKRYIKYLNIKAAKKRAKQGEIR